jgi:hypothetical protein
VRRLLLVQLLLAPGSHVDTGRLPVKPDWLQEKGARLRAQGKGAISFERPPSFPAGLRQRTNPRPSPRYGRGRDRAGGTVGGCADPACQLHGLTLMANPSWGTLGALFSSLEELLFSFAKHS